MVFSNHVPCYNDNEALQEECYFWWLLEDGGITTTKGPNERVPPRFSLIRDGN